MRINKFLCCALSISMLLGTTLNVSAAEEQNYLLDSEEFVKDYFEAINEHDWEKVSEFYHSRTAVDMKAFLTDKLNQDEHMGLLNVEHVEAVEVVDVDYDDSV